MEVTICSQSHLRYSHVFDIPASNLRGSQDAETPMPVAADIEPRIKFAPSTESGVEFVDMEYKLKQISTSGIPEAIAKAELYRSLNEPEEAESICRDILAIEPQHQLALRLLGLALTDQFSGGGPIASGRRRRSFNSCQIRTKGSTTPGFCTNVAQRRSSKPDTRRMPC